MKREWTPEQKDFISAQNGPLLVSAAAGSGKTSAIVERVFKRITDRENPLSCDRLLMMTFSNAAANEMLLRIEKKLNEELILNPDDQTLSLQLEKISSAQISTIHSFCIKTIRENFSSFDISCDFRICDDFEKTVLEKKAMTEVIKEAYRQNDEEFHNLIDLICSSKGDKELSQAISDIYKKVIAMPFPKDVMQLWLQSYDPSEKGYEKWLDALLSDVKEKIELAHTLSEKSASLLEGVNKKEIAQNDADAVLRIEEFLNKKDVKNAHASAGGYSVLHNAYPRKAEHKPTVSVIKAYREQLKGVLSDIASMLENSSFDVYKEDASVIYPCAKKLFDLVGKFMDKFSELKRNKNVIDFSDAEQFMLSLLWQKDENGYVRTQKALEIKAKYDEIYIDEYQDTNAAQEMIFTAISDNDSRIFMVGDIKQSIYGFRQADCEIFSEKKNKFPQYSEKTFPAKISFSSNFRSRDNITEFVNGIFSKVMNPYTCNMTYDKDDMLKANSNYPENENADTEVIICDSNGDESKKEFEAAVVADKIKEMVKTGYMVSDGEEGLRACRYGDFCILLRAMSTNLGEYAAELEKRDIPYITSAEDGNLLEKREISIVLSVLYALNNPFDDVNMAAALMSPVFLFTPDEIANLKLNYIKPKLENSIYNAVKHAAQEGNTNAQRFVSNFEKLRISAASKSVDALLCELYDKYDLYCLVGAMENGENRMANLLILRQYARQFEANGYKGLAGFVRYIKMISDSDNALAGANKLALNSDCVNIMSIHKSKGLEFPVCILANTAGVYNNNNYKGNIIINKDNGFACRITDEIMLLKREPSFYKIAQEKIKFAEKAEEMRLLYVALTRAKEKLIITATVKNLSKKIEDAVGKSRKDLISYSAKNANSYIDLMLLSLVNSKSFESVLLNLGISNDNPQTDFPFLFKIINELPAKEDNSTSPESPVDEQILKTITERIEKQYRFKSQASIVSKYSVSELVKGESEKGFDFETEPDFMSGKKGGAYAGTALHAFMQLCDFKRAKTNVAAEIKCLAECGKLMKSQADALSTKKIEDFFASDLYKRIEKSDKFYREYKFMYKYDSSEFGGKKEAEDTVIVQGIADMVLIEGDCAVIVDYKTDRVDSMSELSKKYSEQLKIYKEAVEKQLGIKIKECIIYSFCLNDTITV